MKHSDYGFQFPTSPLAIPRTTIGFGEIYLSSGVLKLKAIPRFGRKYASSAKNAVRL